MNDHEHDRKNKMEQFSLLMGVSVYACSCGAVVDNNGEYIPWEDLEYMAWEQRSLNRDLSI